MLKRESHEETKLKRIKKVATELPALATWPDERNYSFGFYSQYRDL